MPSAKHTVFFDDISTNVREILAAHDDVAIVDQPHRATLLWLRHGYRDAYAHLAPHQLLNHIPGEETMTRKGELAEILHRHGEANPTATFSHRDFYKETFCLFDPTERRAFLAQLPEKDTEENLWIMKPSTLSRGIGVKVLWQLDELRKELANTRKMTLTREGEELDYIIQRYIKDVLLLHGRKSEMRVYFAILCVHPLRVVMWPEGTVRLTMQEFKLGDYDNPLIHLANVYQQKKHPDYRPDLELKWDFATLQDYVEKDLKLCGPDWIEQTLKPRLRRCLAYITRAAKKRLVRERLPRGLCFGLFGADIMLDQKLNPWITEIQKGPGLSFSDSVKAKVIPPMLGELIHLACEHREIVMKGKHQNTPLESIKRFEWVVREGGDGFFGR
jgi:hypothetical protein